MCLCIQKFFHPYDEKDGVRKPIVAKENILVFKVITDLTTTYHTPYQFFVIHFKNGVYKYKTTRMQAGKLQAGEFDTQGVYIPNCVTKGIHSWIDEKRAERSAENYSNDRVFYCVIPKGAKFYIGDNFDVVSNKLIVYEHKSYYDIANVNAKNMDLYLTEQFEDIV